MNDIRPSFGVVTAYILFFFSGFCALIYEVVWSRMLVLVVGNTTLAAATILTSFMAGLCMGGWYWGRRADRMKQRPLLLFGCLEMGIGITALIVSRMMGAVVPLEIWISQTAGLGQLLPSAIRFFLCFCILICPTFLMGGTLAVVGAYVIRNKDRFAQHVAGLYGINTAGSFLGAFVSGFFLIKLLGHQGSLLTAASLNCLVGALAVGMCLLEGKQNTERISSKRMPRTMSQDPGYPEKTAILVLSGLFISGFCGISCQLLWTRLLILIIDNSVYSFTIILMAFLAGIALGSLISASFFRYVTAPLPLFGAVQICIGIFSFCFPFFIHLTPNNPEAVYWKFLFSTLPAGILLPTIFMGVAFPLGARIYQQIRGGVGKSLGAAYAVNTLGCVAGGAAAGFLFIDYLGFQKSTFFLSGLMLLSGGCMLWLPAGKLTRYATAVLLVFLVAAGVRAMPSDYFEKKYAGLEPAGKLIYYRESAAAAATVFQRPDNNMALYLNGIPEVDTSYLSVRTFKIMGALPGLLSANPKNALMITFGAGIAAGTTALFTEKLDCVDLAAQAREIAPFFAYYNNNIIADEKMSLYNDDARHFLQGSRTNYSIIISDATHPRVYDSWVLFTDEFYRLVRSRLTEDGIFLQWLPFHGLTTDHYLGIVRTFSHVFDHTSIWGIGEGYSLLVATSKPLTIDIRAFLKKLMVPAIEEDLKRGGITNPLEILDAFVMGEENIRKMLSGRPEVMTDNSPAHLFFPFSATFKDQYDRWPLANYQMLTAHQESVVPYLMNISDDASKREKLLDLMRQFEQREQ